MEREQELTKLLEAFNRLRQNADWNLVQELFYKPQVKNIENQILVESLSHKMDSSKLYRLQGEWERAQTNDMDRAIERLIVELKTIKQSNES